MIKEHNMDENNYIYKLEKRREDSRWGATDVR